MEKLLTSLPLPDLIILMIVVFNVIYFLDILFLTQEKNIKSALFSICPFFISFLMYGLFTRVANFDKTTSCSYSILFFIVLLYMINKTDLNPCHMINEQCH